jgi:hypothetical protein
MQVIPPTWRKHPLVLGQAYVALKDFTGGPSSDFVAGCVYVLRHIDYSRYDSMTVFAFEYMGNGTLQQWWWHDEQPDTQLHERIRVAP